MQNLRKIRFFYNLLMWLNGAFHPHTVRRHDLTSTSYFSLPVVNPLTVLDCDANASTIFFGDLPQLDLHN